MYLQGWWDRAVTGNFLTWCEQNLQFTETEIFVSIRGVYNTDHVLWICGGQCYPISSCVLGQQVEGSRHQYILVQRSSDVVVVELDSLTVVSEKRFWFKLLGISMSLTNSMTCWLDKELHSVKDSVHWGAPQKAIPAYGHQTFQPYLFQTLNCFVFLSNGSLVIQEPLAESSQI